MASESIGTKRRESYGTRSSRRRTSRSGNQATSEIPVMTTVSLENADLSAARGPVNLRERNDWLDYGYAQIVDKSLGGEVLLNL